MNDEYAELRRALYVRRVSLGYSQGYVAKTMGYADGTTVSQLENGYPARPDPGTLRRWAAALFYDLTFTCVLTATRTLEKPRTFDITPAITEDDK